MPTATCIANHAMLTADVSNRVQHIARSVADIPAVSGDFVATLWAVIPQCNALREASGAEADRINTRIKKKLVAAGVKARATDERRSCMAREAAKQAQRVENAAQVMQLPSWAKCGRLS